MTFPIFFCHSLRAKNDFHESAKFIYFFQFLVADFCAKHCEIEQKCLTCLCESVQAMEVLAFVYVFTF